MRQITILKDKDSIDMMDDDDIDRLSEDLLNYQPSLKKIQFRKSKKYTSHLDDIFETDSFQTESSYESEPEVAIENTAEVQRQINTLVKNARESGREKAKAMIKQSSMPSLDIKHDQAGRQRSMANCSMKASKDLRAHKSLVNTR